ncbi:hypothetical protein FSPOR_7793 [Fusarium sporotrichioides]|uniref:Uncharacterized protein n=1 Tax=Fusarium sporotrichioides TaxID=5514 RepID=A0A395RX47_FUSSP|nr:hypothetical protein FSPOR_7793 [Fusarium sporotrichioides]
MAGRDSSNNPDIPKDQDSQRESLFDPATPLRFAASKANKATNNNNQDRRTVEQWQLDNANAYVDEITAHLRHCQEEIYEIKDHIGRIDAVQDVAEKQDTTPEKAVRGRSLPRKIMSFFWFIFKVLFLLVVVIVLFYVIKYHVSDDWNYQGYFLDLLDIDYPRFL